MIKENILLKEFTNYQIGGPARFFLSAKNTDEILEALRKWPEISRQAKIPQEKIFVLGKGTNVLVSDHGFMGLVIHPGLDQIERLDNNIIRVGAAATWEELNNYCIENSLAGLEWSGGLPGSIGGAVFGNAGAFGGETKDNIASIESLDLRSLETKIRDNYDCRFSYRSSIFKSKLAQKEIILTITFQLESGQGEEIKKSIDEKIDYRQDHQPLDLPSAGSTFKNVPADSLRPELLEKFKDKIKNDPFPVLPAAVLLANANLIGINLGGAQVSTKHPNFIVNMGLATAQDVKNLIDQIIKIIKEKYDIALEPEIIEIK